jgi:hypothetical protein
MSDSFEATFNEDKSELPVEKPENTEGQTGQPRDEGGRFATKKAADPTPEQLGTMANAQPAPDAQQQAPAPVAQPEPAKAEPGFVPLAAVLDERQKRQDSDREVAELRRQLAQLQQQPQATPSFQSPEDIAAYVRQQTADAAWQATANFSEFNAREKHGDEAVDAAIQWAIQKSQQEVASHGYSPFAVEQQRQRHPVDWIVRQHEAERTAKELGSDREGFIRREAIRLGLIPDPANLAPQPAPQAQASPQPAAPKPAPRPSLASAPTAGGIQTVVVKEPFEAAFK